MIKKIKGESFEKYNREIVEGVNSITNTHFEKNPLKHAAIAISSLENKFPICDNEICVMTLTDNAYPMSADFSKAQVRAYTEFVNDELFINTEIELYNSVLALEDDEEYLQDIFREYKIHVDRDNRCKFSFKIELSEAGLFNAMLFKIHNKHRKVNMIDDKYIKDKMSQALYVINNFLMSHYDMIAIFEDTFDTYVEFCDEKSNIIANAYKVKFDTSDGYSAHMSFDKMTYLTDDSSYDDIVSIRFNMINSFVRFDIKRGVIVRGANANYNKKFSIIRLHLTEHDKLSGFCINKRKLDNQTGRKNMVNVSQKLDSNYSKFETFLRENTDITDEQMFSFCHVKNFIEKNKINIYDYFLNK